MTISTNRTREFTVDQLVELAYSRAGLRTDYQILTAAQYGNARKLLDLAMMDLEAQGVLARSVEFDSVAVTAGVADYSLPETVLEVVGEASWVPQGQPAAAGDFEVPLMQVSLDSWNAIPNKLQSGTPYEFAVIRSTNPLSVKLYYVPAESGSVRFMVQRLRASSVQGAATPDFERYWAEYLVSWVAAELAMSAMLPLNRVKYLRDQAAESLGHCKGKSSRQLASQIRCGHKVRTW